MKTDSENIVDSINSRVFFKEFTFHQNQFLSETGTKELADSFIWLDDLLFVIQIKERNPKEVKTEVEENKWFDKAITKAKKQIEDSIAFLTSGKEISIKNFRDHVIDVSKISTSDINKLIVYMPNSNLLSESNLSLKFYESSRSGNIHVLNIEDYQWICKILITPAEINDYLKFRERIFLQHKNIITAYPEQYILSHFLNTPDVTIIDEHYITSLSQLEDDSAKWDISWIINKFADSLLGDEKTKTNYYHILKEVAKLSRAELGLFKERFSQMIELTKSTEISLPYRFASPRTQCGFVFLALVPSRAHDREIALINFTEIYKYKRKLKRCIGVVANKDGVSYDIHWAYAEGEWAYDEGIEKFVKAEKENYGEGRIEQIVRYKFKKE